ncbi:hypothetical protein GW17_00004028 [Ensete ventricosum]|nr:hypothetical protein GW17_00004028 [Ensete ventricosum]
MPPKGKKSARASLPVAAASPSDRSPLFTRTPMDPSRGSPAGDDDEAVHRRLLAAAASKFPTLISEDRTFCGRITETESSPSNGSHGRVWLSSAAMISNSIAPDPYRPVHTGPTADRYTDRPLPGGTAKIGRWRSISAVCGRFKEKSTVGGRLRKKKERRRRGKEEEEEEEEEKYLALP